MADNTEIMEGSRVTRYKKWADYFNDHRHGTVVIDHGDRCKIKWDEKARTGQQHSTISKRFLTILNTQSK